MFYLIVERPCSVCARDVHLRRQLGMYNKFCMPYICTELRHLSIEAAGLDSCGIGDLPRA